MPKLLDITELGSEILRKKTSDVTNTSDKELNYLVDDMVYTVSEVNGVGLAAPQVNRSISLFIIASEPNQRYPEAPELAPFAVINPEIISVSGEMVTGWEGCLSIPGLRGLVPRHKALKVKYTDISGREVNTELTGFVARIFQHEYDHLNGILFLDRIDIKSGLYTEREFRKIVENQ